MSTQTTTTQAASGGVTLNDLHAANKARQTEWCTGGDPEPDLAFRGNELAGETGEACNVIKKLERERHGWRGSRATLDDLAQELADVIICTDLCAITAGIDLAAAVVAKFNATSEKQGLATKLAAASQAAPVTGTEGEKAWLPMKDAPTGVPIIAKHKPNARMPLGWVATIKLGHRDDEEPGALDTILHYNGDDFYRGFHGCWEGWLPVGSAIPTAAPQPAGAERVRAVLAEWFSDAEGMCRAYEGDLPDKAEIYVVAAKRSRLYLGTYGELRRAALGSGEGAAGATERTIAELEHELGVKGAAAVFRKALAMAKEAAADACLPRGLVGVVSDDVVRQIDGLSTANPAPGESSLQATAIPSRGLWDSGVYDFASSVAAKVAALTWAWADTADAMDDRYADVQGIVDAELRSLTDDMTAGEIYRTPAPCDGSPEGGETHSGSTEGDSAVGVAEAPHPQSPSLSEVEEAKALLKGLPKWLGPQQWIEVCRKTGDHKQADRFEAALATLTASQEQDSEVRT